MILIVKIHLGLEVGFEVARPGPKGDRVDDVTNSIDGGSNFDGFEVVGGANVGEKGDGVGMFEEADARFAMVEEIRVTVRVVMDENVRGIDRADDPKVALG